MSPYNGEFEDIITEDIALYKTEAIIAGHPKVMAALKRFAGLPNKKITYLIGNHDADLFFPSVRERITREWDPEGKFPSQKVELIADRDHVRWEGGVEIHHGNQMEAVHVLDFAQPLLLHPGRKTCSQHSLGEFLRSQNYQSTEVGKRIY